MRDKPRIAAGLIGVLVLAGCADDSTTGPTGSAEGPRATVTAGETPDVTPDATSTEPSPTPADVDLEVFASPSGVVCDLAVMDEYDAPRYDGARWAKCWVPDPQYPASVFDE